MTTVAQEPVKSQPITLDSTESSKAIVPKTPSDLLELAVLQGANVDQLGKLMDLQLRWQAEEARRAFYAALHRLKGDLPEIFKTGHKQGGLRNGKEQADYWFAELDKACPQIIAALHKYDFTHQWRPDPASPGKVRITCVLKHVMGHSEDYSLEGPQDETGGKNGIQSVGSSVTYLQRYTLFAALGIAPKGADTDGQASGIPLGLRAERCGEIAACNTIESLRAKYQAAYTEARAQKDKDATILYTEAYEQRKDQILGGAQ